MFRYCLYQNINYLCKVNEAQNFKKNAMKTINRTEWYEILSKEYAKYEWIMKEMNETQVSELTSSIRTKLKQQYKVI